MTDRRSCSGSHRFKCVFICIEFRSFNWLFLQVTISLVTSNKIISTGVRFMLWRVIWLSCLWAVWLIMTVSCNDCSREWWNIFWSDNSVCWSRKNDWVYDRIEIPFLLYTAVDKLMLQSTNPALYEKSANMSELWSQKKLRLNCESLDSIVFTFDFKTVLSKWGHC